jgi:hypothetical protein
VSTGFRELAADPRIPEEAAWEFFCECGSFNGAD